MIRDARPSDAEALARVWRAVLNDGRGMALGPDGAKVRSTEPRNGGVYLVAEQDGEPVGEATLTPLRPAWCGHVGVLGMHVDPSAQRRGIGRALLSALIERAPGLGLRRLELYVRTDNHRAIRLYRSVGFVVEGASHRFRASAAAR